jgi:Tfp pilus assembly protein PilX
VDTATLILLVVVGLLVIAGLGYAIHRIRVNRMWNAVDRAINQSSILPPDQS